MVAAAVADGQPRGIDRARGDTPAKAVATDTREPRGHGDTRMVRGNARRVQPKEGGRSGGGVSFKKTDVVGFASMLRFFLCCCCCCSSFGKSGERPRGRWPWFSPSDPSGRAGRKKGEGGTEATQEPVRLRVVGGNLDSCHAVSAPPASPRDLPASAPPPPALCVLCPFAPACLSCGSYRTEAVGKTPTRRHADRGSLSIHEGVVWGRGDP